jgi:surface antigen
MRYRDWGVGVNSLRTGTRAGVVAVVVVSLGLAGCADMSPETKETIGTVGGAVAGGLLCKFAGINGAACIGLILATSAAGFVIAKEIDERDRAARQAAVDKMLAEQPAKQTAWTSQATGNTGKMILLSKFTNAQGEECRKFRETYNKKGVATPITEDYSMCRGADNKWTTVK